MLDCVMNVGKRYYHIVFCDATCFTRILLITCLIFEIVIAFIDHTRFKCGPCLICRGFLSLTFIASVNTLVLCTVSYQCLINCLLENDSSAAYTKSSASLIRLNKAYTGVLGHVVPSLMWQLVMCLLRSLICCQSIVAIISCIRIVVRPLIAHFCPIKYISSKREVIV